LPAVGNCIEDELNIMALQIRDDCYQDTTGEYHVASFVAQVIDTEMDRVKQAIEQIDGSDIHVISPEGKIVFTLEGSHQAGIGRNIDKLKDHPGLLSLAPVYHQFITESSDPEPQAKIPLTQT
jgi:nitrate reductase NapD